MRACEYTLTNFTDNAGCQPYPTFLKGVSEDWTYCPFCGDGIERVHSLDYEHEVPEEHKGLYEL